MNEKLFRRTRLPLSWNGKKWYIPELHTALAQLTTAEAVAIHLRYWEQYTVMQIARHWGLCWDSADRLLRRAEEKLRQEFIKQYQQSLLQDRLTNQQKKAG